MQVKIEDRLLCGYQEMIMCLSSKSTFRFQHDWVEWLSLIIVIDLNATKIGINLHVLVCSLLF